jgi:bifunctional DNase/RNase
MFIEMKVSGIILDPVSNVPIVILKDADEKHTLPIWIGLLEASAIAMELEKIKVHRPLTHDLLKNVLEQLKVSVIKIEITDLKDNTYYALIHLQSQDAVMAIDSRPSDAIALALRTESPIFVAKSVLDKSRQLDAKESEFTQENRDKWTEILESLDPEDFGKYKM